MTFKEFVIYMCLLYGTTTITSLTCNKKYYINKINNSYKNCKKRLVYRDLSMSNGAKLKGLYNFCKLEKLTSILKSFAPFYQIYFTIKNIDISEEAISYFFNEKIDEINKKEINLRKEHLQEMKEATVIPEEIKEKMNNEEYLPNESDYFEIKVLNLKQKKEH